MARMMDRVAATFFLGYLRKVSRRKRCRTCQYPTSTKGINIVLYHILIIILYCIIFIALYCFIIMLNHVILYYIKLLLCYIVTYFPSNNLTPPPQL